jgi:hypothetical protein
LFTIELQAKAADHRRRDELEDQVTSASEQAIFIARKLTDAATSQ